jgi:hypothetical protein
MANTIGQTYQTTEKQSNAPTNNDATIDVTNNASTDPKM